MRRVLSQARLDLIPQLARDNRLMLTGVALLSVPNLTDVKRIGQQLV